MQKSLLLLGFFLSVFAGFSQQIFEKEIDSLATDSIPVVSEETLVSLKGRIEATYLSFPPQWMHVGGSNGSIFLSGLEIAKPKDSSIRAEIFSSDTEEPGLKKP